MVRKRFSRELYAQYDDLAKEAADKMVEYFCVDNFTDGDNQYKVDRKGIKDGEHILNVEVEVKMAWAKGLDDFPYDEINLPERKEKYTKLDKPTSFVIFSKDLKGAVVFTDHTVSNCNKVEVKNKYCPQGELFFKIPIEKSTHLVLNSEGTYIIN